MTDVLSDAERTVHVLNEILKTELSGVVRYTHYSLVIMGPNRIPLVTFMQSQAAESLLHAQQAGEILTGLGGTPEQGIASLVESHNYEIDQLLRASIEHERVSLKLYRDLLQCAVNQQSVYLEEFARGQIGAEEKHLLEMNKMLRDYSIR
jgi:bacterioferritin